MRWIRILLVAIAVVCFGVALSYPIRYRMAQESNNSELEALSALRASRQETEAPAAAATAMPAAEPTAAAATQRPAETAASRDGATAVPTETPASATELPRPEATAEAVLAPMAEPAVTAVPTEEAPAIPAEDETVAVEAALAQADAVETPIQTVEPTAPLRETPTPTKEAPVQEGTTPVIVEDTPVPTEDTPVQEEATPVIVAETPIPVETTPVPTEETPVTAEETPVPEELLFESAEEVLILGDETPVPEDGYAPDDGLYLTGGLILEGEGDELVPEAAADPEETALPGATAEPAAQDQPTPEVMAYILDPDWLLTPAPTPAAPTPEPTPTPVPSPTPDRRVHTGALPYPMKEKATLDPDAMLPELKEIYALNHDLVGWINIPDTVIDYPVVQTQDSEFYLTHDFYGKENQNGQIILDTLCDPYTPSYNLVISGHHMKNGSMFGNLPMYASKSYWEKHKLVEFDTLMARKQYVVFAAFYSADYDEDEEGFRYNADIQYAKEAELWFAEIRENQLYDTEVDVEFGDEFITLTTCNRARHRNGRFVVVCRKIREGETFE